MLDRIYENWVYGGAAAALVLLLLTPVLGLDPLGTLTFLALPIYMIHQFEEHDADRFRLYVNEMLGPNAQGLSHRAVFIINFAGVWLFLTAALWLTKSVSDSWAVLAAYLLLVNGVVHVLPALILRRYNPGLVTASLLFFPLGLAIGAAANATVTHHLIAFVLVFVLHGAIVVHARRRTAA